MLTELESNSFSDKENTTPTTDNETTISESLSYDTVSMSTDINSIGTPNSSKETSPAHISTTLPSKLDVKKLDWDEIDDLLQVERKVDDSEHVYRTMPSYLPSKMTGSTLSDISTDLSMSMSTDEITSTTTTTSYKTLTPGIDSGSGSSESQTIYYSPLQSSNEKSPDGEPDSNAGNNNHSIESNEDEEEDTPTLKPCDYEEFKKQAKKDYMISANNMKNVTDGTLKFNQPIDPSRINDSLKLYSESIMSKSMNEESPGMYSLSNSCFIPGQISSFNINDTLNLLKNNQSSSSSSDDRTLKHESNKRGPYLKKSISMGAASISGDSPVDDDIWAQTRGLLKSKSGPNYSMKSDDEYSSDTVKPSGKSSSISIKMDCYDEIVKNNSTASSSASTTPTTPTSQSETYVTADSNNHFVNEDGVILRRRPKPGSTAIKRRSGNRR